MPRSLTSLPPASNAASKEGQEIFAGAVRLPPHRRLMMLYDAAARGLRF